MNKLIKFVLCLSLVLLITGCKMENNKIEVQPIDKSLAIQKIEDGAILIDVRTASEYSANHIEGAINIDVTEILSLKGELGYNNRNISKNTVLILYCRSGNRSLQAANKLIELGYTNVYDLGSIENWS